MNHDRIHQRLRGTKAMITALDDMVDDIASMCAALTSTLDRGGTLYTCGNGGSAAQAAHLAEELIGRYRGDRPSRRGVCLNADAAALTCIANDFGYENVFARQCEALLTPNDLLAVLSTSGNSPNVVAALNVARERGTPALGLLGGSGGDAAGLCDLTIVVPSSDSAHVQEAHMVLLHLLCEAVEAMG